MGRQRLCAEVFMKERQGYKGYVIEARSHQLQAGGFSAEFSIEDHGGAGVTETVFYVKRTFPAHDAAIKTALQAGKQKIDSGFEPGTQDNKLSTQEIHSGSGATEN